jgi:hypothetical protein
MSEHLMSERLAIVSVIDPDLLGSGTSLGDAIDMRSHRQVMFIVMAGSINTADTIDFKVTQSATSGGTYTPITGKAITQIVKAGAKTQAVINVRASELGTDKRWLKGRLYMTGVTGTKTGACVLTLASHSRHSDAVTSTTFGDLASVAEIVA